MAHPYHHALSSTHRWGGEPGDYLAIHSWFDESKAHFADFATARYATTPKASTPPSSASASRSRPAPGASSRCGGRGSSTSKRTSARTRPPRTGCAQSGLNGG